ncbi:MAG: GTPase Era [Burkholderiales bacterium]|nr:GTPase Era [Burkholderiales bacterium]MCE7876029.1 GTPase Era [Betaproteobacteria bacterium PRO3]
MTFAAPSGHRCGHVAIVGRPSVGKSTLLNALVGERISITSRKPQTTRHRINGIVSRPQAQIVFVDTPGFQTRHASPLNTRLNRAVREALADVDAVVWVVDGARIAEPDRGVLALVPEGKPVIAALNKVDAIADKTALLPRIAEVAAMREFAAIVPISAERGTALALLEAEIVKLLPPGPALYGPDELTDRDERFLAAEYLREQIFRRLGDEVPYATTVGIESFEHEGDARRIHAVVWVDKPGQRAILLGEGGATMKTIATEARKSMLRLFGGRVHLEVWVRVKKGWASSDATLARLGY